MHTIILVVVSFYRMLYVASGFFPSLTLIGACTCMSAEKKKIPTDEAHHDVDGHKVYNNGQAQWVKAGTVIREPKVRQPPMSPETNDGACSSGKRCEEAFGACEHERKEKE